MTEATSDLDDIKRVGGAMAGAYGGAVVGLKAGCAATCATAPILGPFAPLAGIAVALCSTAVGGKMGYDKPSAGLLAGLGGWGGNTLIDGGSAGSSREGDRGTAGARVGSPSRASHSSSHLIV
jgi:hypothetical protein